MGSRGWGRGGGVTYLSQSVKLSWAQERRSAKQAHSTEKPGKARETDWDRKWVEPCVPYPGRGEGRGGPGDESRKPTPHQEEGLALPGEGDPYPGSLPVRGILEPSRARALPRGPNTNPGTKGRPGAGALPPSAGGSGTQPRTSTGTRAGGPPP